MIALDRVLHCQRVLIQRIPHYGQCLGTRRLDQRSKIKDQLTELLEHADDALVCRRRSSLLVRALHNRSVKFVSRTFCVSSCYRLLEFTTLTMCTTRQSSNILMTVVRSTAADDAETFIVSQPVQIPTFPRKMTSSKGTNIL
ncbi:hypothetical protein PRIPAC_86723 [Pristionchus pacificus]|uniref:Uncharacterized protein n=1 Tax=Pristionchus pacificus TaxID=54126 RepID=A0A2A6BTW2_PRIPA|nr:hypothetical protein PRIPAC_86723 [Pristionchus pacificus]|eukprot:PDM69243.1 hypothetical protein PRIPAC_47545 [Pristionchus pacificus]